MDDFEKRVRDEIARLEGPEFPRSSRAKQQRWETIRALAEAAVAGEPWTGPNGVLGPNRPTLVVSETNFYTKKHWWLHPLTREVLDSVIRLYAERDAAERERARLAKKAWLENKEFEAAETQFAKADDLLSLPHIKKTSKVGEGGDTTIYLDPANAAVFSAAVRLNMSASDLARRSLGLPTEVKRSELTGADGGPIATRDGLDEVDDDELHRRIGTLARGALAVLGGGTVADVEAGAEAEDSEGEE
jgi:hypothetical protein